MDRLPTANTAGVDGDPAADTAGSPTSNGHLWSARSDIPCPKCRQGARAIVFGNVLAPISRIIRLVRNASLTSFTPAATATPRRCPFAGDVDDDNGCRSHRGAGSTTLARLILPTAALSLRHPLQRSPTDTRALTCKFPIDSLLRPTDERLLFHPGPPAAETLLASPLLAV